MKTVVVTGGTGFIGTPVVSALLASHYKVIVLTRIQKKSSQKNLSFVACDFFHPQLFSKLAKKLPKKFILLDIGAKIPTGETVSIRNYIETNCISHIALVEAVQAHIEKIVFLSTVDVYGAMQGKKLVEDQVKNPLTSYGLSKALLEDFYLFFHREQSIPVTLLRLSQVYGPGAHPINALPRFLNQVQKQETLCLFGKGEETRTYIHIQDVVQAILLSIKKSHTGIYNVAGEETKTLGQLLTLVKQFSPIPIHVEQKPRVKPIMHQRMDISKIKKELNFHPNISLEQGIKNFYAHIF